MLLTNNPYYDLISPFPPRFEETMSTTESAIADLFTNPYPTSQVFIFHTPGTPIYYEEELVPYRSNED